MSTESTCDLMVPPTFGYHILEHNAPSVYIIFWSISAVSLFITSIVILPRLYRLKQAAIGFRDKNDDLMMPFSYVIIMFIVAFPFITVLLNFLILIAPVTALTFDLMISLYSATVLYYFARLVIMFLGSFKAAHEAWKSQAPKTKFYASGPCCCCLSMCLKPKNMTKRDFRRIYFCIQQYMFLGPFVSFSTLFPAIPEYERVSGTIKMISTLFCVYGTQSLLTASKEVLSEYNIDGKFKVIQLGFMSISLPSAIIEIIGVPQVNDMYNSDVMITAYSSVITCGIHMILSFGFRYWFNQQTANEADRNMKNQSYTNPNVMDKELVEQTEMN